MTLTVSPTAIAAFSRDVSRGPPSGATIKKIKHIANSRKMKLATKKPDAIAPALLPRYL
jgi:hypothetical protein